MSEVKGFFGEGALQALGDQLGRGGGLGALGGDGQGASDVDLRKILSAIDALWDHKDELLRLATKLPPLLGDAGELMNHAGQGAQRASGFLTNEVRDITGTAAHVLAISTAQLGNVLDVLEGVGRALQKLPFIDDLGDMISDGIAAIRGVSDNVGDVGQKVRALGDRLGNVGSDLDRVGQSLVGGGTMLADFGGKSIRPIAGFAGLPPIATPAVKVKPVRRAKPTATPRTGTSRNAKAPRNAAHSAADPRSAAPPTSKKNAATKSAGATVARPAPPRKSPSVPGPTNVASATTRSPTRPRPNQ
jgi:hypothetical protein